MEKTMTPSETTITAGQIGKIQEVLGAALRKSGLLSEPTQQVVTDKSAMGKLTDELLAVIRKRVEAISDMIVRRVRVDRSRSPQEALDATGRRQYTTQPVVDAMPRGKGEEVEVVFFKPSPDAYDATGLIGDDAVEIEFDLRGLKPADPYSLCKANEDDPAFADEHPNATHWKDEDGNWCYVAFNRWNDERNVNVNRDDSGWSRSCRFAGVCK